MKAQTKTEYLQSMQQNLIDLENAARKLSEEWGNDKDFDIDLNSPSIINLYPFAKSFDEVAIDIAQWVSHANQGIENFKDNHNKLKEILDFGKCKEMVDKAIENNSTDNVILCPLYSINIQRNPLYDTDEGGENLQWDLDELEAFIGHSIEVSDYDDLIVNLNHNEE